MASSNVDSVKELMDIPADDDESVGEDLKVSKEKVIGKNSLKKKLTKEGESWETLSFSDEVEGKN